MARTKEIKKDIMEFWFYQWMMEEKKILFDDYCGKSENDIIQRRIIGKCVMV